MRVRIVCYEDVDSWILGKFAKKLQHELTKLSIETDIAKVADPMADINHHIIYIDYNGQKNSVDTIMITHIDSLQKLNLLKKQIKNAEVGICMSYDTMQKLIEAGIPKNRLYYINPAMDGVIKPRSIVIGITSKIHEDGRKKENMLLKLCKKIPPQNFCFKIMGSGWDDIVSKIRSLGFMIEYHNKFDYDEYVKLIPSLDYFIYFGCDEGSMGFIDALSAGVKTIVTPQGYHLDVHGGITYPINNFDDVENTFKKIIEEKKILIESVSNWTWSNYAKEHLSLWTCLIKNKNFMPLLENKVTIRNNQSLSVVKKKNKFIYLNYLIQPLTIKTSLWKITPNLFKNMYKKSCIKNKNNQYDRTNNK